VGQPGSRPGRQTLGREDVTGSIGNVELINSGFHTRNNLAENIPQFGHATSELLASPILGGKS